MSWLDRRRPKKKFSHKETRRNAARNLADQRFAEYRRSLKGRPSYLVPLGELGPEQGFTYSGWTPLRVIIDEAP